MTEGYVLHSLPWRETSLIVEAFTEADGRMGLVARGARRPRSANRGLLIPFQPLMLRYSAKGELRSLTGVEWQGGLGLLSGEPLMAGFYLNELLLRLLPREAPEQALFAAYEQALQALSQIAAGEMPLRWMEPLLRQFESQLLEILGVSPWLGQQDVQPDQAYWVAPAEGILPQASAQALVVQEDLPQGGQWVTGQTLQALAQSQTSLSAFAEGFALATDPDGQRGLNEAKRLLRSLIRHQLGGQELVSRSAARDLINLAQTDPQAWMADPSSLSH